MVPFALAAARNNADWVDIVCRAHGLSPTRGPRLWSSPSRTPPFHPDAITLVPGVGTDEIVPRIEPGPSASVKDSFADLDLAHLGYRVLFDATWIAQRTDRWTMTWRGLSWRVVDDATSLTAWAEAAGDTHNIFRSELLENPDVRIVAGHDGPRLRGGFVANRSPDVVGLSNVFAINLASGEVWPEVVTVARDLFPGLPLVGYERDDALDDALDAGFEPVGPLRVWMN